MRRTWTSWLVVAALATCGAKKTKAPKGEEGAADAAEGRAPSLPGPLVDDPRLRPPIVADGKGLDIQTMDRTRTTMDFTLDAGFLGQVAAGAREDLLRTLAADPRWRVHETSTGVHASLRGDDREVLASGYNRAGPGAWGVFLAADGDPLWGAPSGVAQRRHADDHVEVEALPTSDEGWRGHLVVAFELEAPAVRLGVHEAAPNGRHAVAEALGEAARTLDSAVSTLDLVATDGVAGMYLPAGEPAKGGSLTLKAVGGGLVDLRARVATPDWGWTWVRLVKDGRPWEEDLVGRASREMIGAGGDGAFFYLQSTFPLPAGAAFEAVAEVWFQARGKAPVRLAAYPVTVPAR